MNSVEKKVFRRTPPKRAARLVETIYGCKWSLTVYELVAQGIVRPGEMTRSVEGLSTKVLNACLRKNVEFGILEKQVFAESPPRVEYTVTDFGQKFLRIVDEIERLDQEIEPPGDATS